MNLLQDKNKIRMSKLIDLIFIDYKLEKSGIYFQNIAKMLKFLYYLRLILQQKWHYLVENLIPYIFLPYLNKFQFFID